MRKVLLVLLVSFFALSCQNTNDFNTRVPTIIEEEESNTLFTTPTDEFGETPIEDQHDDPNTLFFRQNAEGFRMEEVPYPVGGIERERVVNHTESLIAFTLCDEFCGVFVEDISANRVYELKAPSFIPGRHFLNLVWIQEKILAFDQSTQPHLRIHYVVDVEEQELINVYPFPVE
jgi:hypothetical protein